MKEVFKFICPQIPLLAENRVFSLFLYIGYKYGNLSAVRSGEKCNALQHETHRSAMGIAMQCVGQLNGMDYFCYSASLILPDGKRTDMFQTAVPYGSHRRLSTRTAIPGWLCSWQEL